MRGYQISDELRSIGLNSRVLSEQELLNEIINCSLSKDTLVVLLRETVGNIDIYQSIKEYGCKVVLDFIDFGEPLSIGANYPLRYNMGGYSVDGFIFPNKSYHFDYAPFCGSAATTCIYHHIDPRLESHSKDDEFAIYAVGSYHPHVIQNSLVTTGYFEKSNTYTTDEVFCFSKEEMGQDYKNYNCMVATRGQCNENPNNLDGYTFDNEVLARYKSNVRLSVSVGTRQVIILGKEDAYEELLGEEYPYWIKGERPNCHNSREIKSAIDFAKNTYKEKEWEIAKDMLASLESRLCINNIAKEYIKFFKQVL